MSNREMQRTGQDLLVVRKSGPGADFKKILIIILGLDILSQIQQHLSGGRNKAPDTEDDQRSPGRTR